jgi:hypothetical protein
MEMNTIAQRLEQAYPDSTRPGIESCSFYIQLTGGKNVRIALWILFGAVVCVLLIACTNVANLMLARGIAREREMAIRMALGAGRLRLVRQLLTESTILAILAGVVGFTPRVGWYRGVLSFSPPDIPQLESVSIDAKVLLFDCRYLSNDWSNLWSRASVKKTSQSAPGARSKEGRSSTGGVEARRLRGLLFVT